MKFKIKTLDAAYKPNNLSGLITQIRRYKKQSIIEISGSVCWRTSKSREDDKKQAVEHHLFCAYAPKITMLALATGINQRILEAGTRESTVPDKQWKVVPQPGIEPGT